MTITEALAEIKTIQKRLEVKREFISNFLFRVDSLKDPHEKDGGSPKLIAEAGQAIHDLEERIITLRLAIQKANENNKITVEGDERTIADWLVWRREVAPGVEKFLFRIRSMLNSARDQLRRQQQPTWGVQNVVEKPADLVVNINEQDLAKQSEKIKAILGQLDGLLSLKNATLTVEV